VTTLIGVTIYILIGATGTIRSFHEEHGDGAEETDDTDVEIMLLFSSINLLIDVINMYIFVKDRRSGAESTSASGSGTDGEVDFDSSGDSNSDNNSDSDSRMLSAKGDNMNMCSAYTHVFADTLRSIAVLVAASIAEITGANGEYCDAVAAIVVSAIIGVSSFPLIVGLYVGRENENEERSD